MILWRLAMSIHSVNCAQRSNEHVGPSFDPGCLTMNLLMYRGLTLSERNRRRLPLAAIEIGGFAPARRAVG
jgi:hypothetical protein